MPAPMQYRMNNNMHIVFRQRVINIMRDNFTIGRPRDPLNNDEIQDYINQNSNIIDEMVEQIILDGELNLFSNKDLFLEYIEDFLRDFTTYLL
jgi:hypothetical protein